MVRTDHQALKFLLEQKVSTVAQQCWLSKLLGYDFDNEFKKGWDNKVADALSRQSEFQSDPADISISLISFPTPTWVVDLKSSYQFDQQALDLLGTFQSGAAIPKGFPLQQGLLLYKGRIWLIKHSHFQKKFWSSSILILQPATQATIKPFIAPRSTSFGRVCGLTSKPSFSNAGSARKINMKLSCQPGYFNPYLFPHGFGSISPSISLRASLFLRGFPSSWSL